jgi:hypothetical protein
MAERRAGGRGHAARPGDRRPDRRRYHPAGAHAWSLDAPIAPAWFPTNRCDAWRCRSCARVFLRYVEYGGYYTEERIRELDDRLVVDAPLTA